MAKISKILQYVKMSVADFEEAANICRFLTTVAVRVASVGPFLKLNEGKTRQVRGYIKFEAGETKLICSLSMAGR